MVSTRSRSYANKMNAELLKRFNALDAKLDAISTDLKTANGGVARLESLVTELQNANEKLTSDNAVLNEKVVALENKCWANEIV